MTKEVVAAVTPATASAATLKRERRMGTPSSRVAKAPPDTNCAS
ncbi:hypothetical protein KEM60_03212 [Austwickia sp. TVS 96-490-7B]|nr:hypothetical protein [Austwickia sp. TVS 96-490-7B]